MTKRVYIGIGIGETAKGELITPGDANAVIRRAEEILAIAFGGYSIHRVVGGWRDDTGRLIREPGIGILSYTDSESAKIRRVTGYLKRLFDQKAVVLEITEVGSLEYI